LIEPNIERNIMTRKLSAFEQKKEHKFIWIRRLMIAAFVSGLILFSYINIAMGGRGASNLGQVYGILLGGTMVFAGGMGIGATTLFLRLLRKDKKKSW